MWEQPTWDPVISAPMSDTISIQVARGKTTPSACREECKPGAIRASNPDGCV